KLIFFYGCDYKGKNQTPAAWELYDLEKDPKEMNNVYDDPEYAEIRDQLKQQFAELRKEVGDDGSHHSECEKVVQDYWNYDEQDQVKAIAISREFRLRRETMLEEIEKTKNGK
ncbi:MAG: sulfatase/phosphatase domain-containing protein, partial [Planctomycetota bacterium]